MIPVKLAFDLHYFVWTWTHCPKAGYRSWGIPVMESHNCNDFFVVYREPNFQDYVNWWNRLKLIHNLGDMRKRWRIAPLRDILGFAYRSTGGSEIAGYRESIESEWILESRNVQSGKFTAQSIRVAGWWGPLTTRPPGWTRKKDSSFVGFYQWSNGVLTDKLGHGYHLWPQRSMHYNKGVADERV